MLGMNLVTIQTGPAGRIVKRLLVEEGLDIKRELYLSLLVDRASAHVIFMASAAGGVEIEEVARTIRRRSFAKPFHPAIGLQPYQARKLAFGLGLSGKLPTVLPRSFRRCIARSWTPTRRCWRSILAYSLRWQTRRSRRQDDL